MARIKSLDMMVGTATDKVNSVSPEILESLRVMVSIVEGYGLSVEQRAGRANRVDEFKSHLDSINHMFEHVENAHIVVNTINEVLKPK